METTLHEAPRAPTPPPTRRPADTAADAFVAWAADVDDDTWRSIRVRVENLRIQRRRDARA